MIILGLFMENSNLYSNINCATTTPIFFVKLCDFLIEDTRYIGILSALMFRVVKDHQVQGYVALSAKHEYLFNFKKLIVPIGKVICIIRVISKLLCIIRVVIRLKAEYLCKVSVF